MEVAEFADHEIHRMGEVTPLERKEPNAFEAGRTIAAITSAFGMSKDDFCGPTKNAASVMAKHLLILAARDAGASVNQVAQLVSIDPSNVSRHYDEARRALASDSKLRYAKKLVDRQCEESTTKSQA